MPPVAEPPQIKTVALLGGVSFERAVPLSDARDYLEDPQNILWMDVQDPGENEIGMLLELFGFHPLALEDVAKGHQRPKVDEYKGHVFAVTYALVRGSKGPIDFRTVEIDLFVGRNFLVTVHRGPVPSIDEAHTRWAKGGPMLQEGVGFLVYSVTDAIVDSYFPVVNRIEDVLDRAEDEMMSGPTERQVENLLDVRREVLRLRRIMYPMREAFAQLTRRERKIFTPNTQIYFQDVSDHILRVLDLIDTQRDLVTSALEASLTIVSNRLNVTMKRLTTISVVAGFAGAVFGAWGMNFPVLPAAESPYGFPLVVGGVIVILIVVLSFGRSRGWL